MGMLLLIFVVIKRSNLVFNTWKANLESSFVSLEAI